MFEPYHDAQVAIFEKYGNSEDGTARSFVSGYRNMLENAIFSFYQAGHTRYAQKIYDSLKKKYSDKKEYKVPLTRFVWRRLREELESGIGLNDAKENVQTLLRKSYFRYALRDDDEAIGFEQMAEETHKMYQSMYRDDNRIDLPDLKLMRYLALIDFLNDRQFPVSLRMGLGNRIRVERPKLAEELQIQEQLQIEKFQDQKQQQQ